MTPTERYLRDLLNMVRHRLMAIERDFTTFAGTREECGRIADRIAAGMQPEMVARGSGETT